LPAAAATVGGVPMLRVALEAPGGTHSGAAADRPRAPVLDAATVVGEAGAGAAALRTLSSRKKPFSFAWPSLPWGASMFRSCENGHALPRLQYPDKK
jgi:hypothetical protein